MSELIQEEKQMVKLLQERGYAYDDPAFTILFFSATHLPFIRVTPIGLYDVKSGKVVAMPVNVIKNIRRKDPIKDVFCRIFLISSIRRL